MFMYFPGFGWILTGFEGIWTSMDFDGFGRTSTDFDGLCGTLMDCDGFGWIFVWLSHVFWWIWMEFHGLCMIFIDLNAF